MRSLLLALLVALSLPVQAVRPSQPMEACRQHLPYSEPHVRRADTTKVCRQGYALEHDNRAKIPIWVAYTLTPERAVGCFPRTSDWQPDPSLRPDARAVPKDYAKSGYDIGHMANNSDARWDRLVEAESNVLSNAAPQLPSLNRGPWKRLEDQTRAWTIERGTHLLVYVGPIYDAQAPSTIGAGRVTVPRAFYKVLVDQRAKEVVAFIYPADAQQGDPGTFRVSLAEVQRQTGINFYLPKGFNLAPLSLWRTEAKSARKAKSVTCSAP